MRLRAAGLAGTLLVLAFAPPAHAQSEALGLSLGEEELTVTLKPLPDVPALDLQVPVPSEVQEALPPAARDLLSQVAPPRPQTPAPAPPPAAGEPAPPPAAGGLGTPLRRSGGRAQPPEVVDSRAGGGGSGEPDADVAVPVASPASAAGSPGTRDASGGADDRGEGGERSLPLARIVTDVVNVLPGWVKALLAALAVLAAALAAFAVAARIRARGLERDGETLLQDAGLLEDALLPSVPDRLGPLLLSVGVQPADSPPAGRGFYEVFALPRNRVGIVVGEVSRHGGAPLPRATLMRYTLRAHLELGLQPRTVLRRAGDLRKDDPHDGFAMATVAVYDGSRGTLEYACAGQGPPAVVLRAREPFAPIPHFSAPLGLDAPVGERETTLMLPPDGLACLYTDGAGDLRSPASAIDWDALAEFAADEGAGGDELLTRIRADAPWIGDDIIVCLLRPTVVPCGGPSRVEELVVRPADGAIADSFLAACGTDRFEAAELSSTAVELAREGGEALLRLSWDGARPEAEVLALAPEPEWPIPFGPGVLVES